MPVLSYQQCSYNIFTTAVYTQDLFWKYFLIYMYLYADHNLSAYIIQEFSYLVDEFIVIFKFTEIMPRYMACIKTRAKQMMYPIRGFLKRQWYREWNIIHKCTCCTMNQSQPQTITKSYLYRGYISRGEMT